MPVICISTHTPLAGRDAAANKDNFGYWNFNSHAPCGARPASCSAISFNDSFQLTRPLRGATSLISQRLTCALISTHTPLAGRDRHDGATPTSAVNFNSHAPCGARQGSARIEKNHKDFNSHAPCGARPPRSRADRAAKRFQLTRPLRGATHSARCTRLTF